MKTVPFKHVAVSLCLALTCSIFNANARSTADAQVVEVRAAAKAAYDKALTNRQGKNADYIPALAKVDPNLLGASIMLVDGKKIDLGDYQKEFAIESISKVFTLALAMKDHSAQVVFDKVGVNATGLPFNSVMAIEQHSSGKAAVNPLVNAGAIATTSLVVGKTPEEKYNRILETMSIFANRKLTLNQEVYESEAATNQHNQAIAVLLQSYNRLYDDPMQSTDVYTKACSVNVTAEDLAIMGAVLANGGIHPITKQQLLTKEQVAHILSIMATSGLYETSGDWLYWTGIPAKSGVGGGILAVVPGKMAIAVFSPPLDGAGNSVRGQQIIKELSQALGLNIFN